MKKIFAIIGIIIIIITGGLVYQNLFKRVKKASPNKGVNMTETLQNKKIVMVIAFKNFRDEEYYTPKKIFEKAGIEVKTASSQKGQAFGVDGGVAEIDYLVSEVNPADFDAVVFVGGPGCLQCLDNDNSYRLVEETVSQDRILGSICISPVILAKAGALKGRQATVWSSPLNRNPVKILQEYGAIYKKEPVVIDGKIITGNGPAAAKEFGETIVKALTEN